MALSRVFVDESNSEYVVGVDDTEVASSSQSEKPRRLENRKENKEHMQTYLEAQSSLTPPKRARPNVILKSFGIEASTLVSA